MLRPPDLIGHISLNISVGSAADARDAAPVKVIAPFQRMRDSKTRGAHEVGMMLPVQDKVAVFNFYTPCLLIRALTKAV
jgi:pre-rRNA-processing protein IPI3